MNFLGAFEVPIIILAHLLSWLVVGHSLLYKNNPRSALGWSMLIIFLPVVGSLIYLIFGIERAESRAAKLMRMAKLNAPQYELMTKKNISLEYENIKSLKPEFQSLALIGSNITKHKLCRGNSINPLFNGDEAYPQMIKAIEKAKNYIYLCTYIFNSGHSADAFCKALIEAAGRGVDVRVIIDGMGKYYSLAKPWKGLHMYGVKVAEFLPPRINPPNVAINLRNHRKILVADNVGFTGGMNISDGNVQTGAKFSVQDVHFACAGPIVSKLREAFLLDWGFCTLDYDTTHKMTEEINGNILCRMILDGPGSGQNSLHDLYYSAMSAARKSISIMTPYFLPTREVVGALKAASARGVDVRIILPEKNNLCFVHWASMRVLPTLLEFGVRIFYQPAPFAHTKLFLVDEYYTQIGSANLDARSLRLNFELNLECFEHSFAKKMQAYFDEAQEKSRAYTLENANSTTLAARLRNAAFWIFSPYL